MTEWILVVVVFFESCHFTRSNPQPSISDDTNLSLFITTYIAAFAAPPDIAVLTPVTCVAPAIAPGVAQSGSPYPPLPMVFSVEKERL
jgi:hypothetical protein